VAELRGKVPARRVFADNPGCRRARDSVTVSAMPGIHFDVVMSQAEIDELAEQAVHATARRLADRAFPPLEDVGVPAEEAEALAHLHALVYLQRAAERCAERAAKAAAGAGAGYPDLAAALAMTRQGARKRYPHLIERHPHTHAEEKS
jgi:hypothetical protein